MNTPRLVGKARRRADTLSLVADSISIVLNGTERSLEGLGNEPSVAALVESLGFRADRVALERNGDIVPRTAWAGTVLEAGDRIELVHFVGGGIAASL